MVVQLEYIRRVEMNLRDSKRGLLNFQFGDGSHSHFLADMRLKKLKNPPKPTQKEHWTKGIFESLIF